VFESARKDVFDDGGHDSVETVLVLGERIVGIKSSTPHKDWAEH
jgi:hypothetical protein